ncbi:ComF family protein [Pseudonocardia sp. TRM90224]|uniref:ComF family protein n=1 Tax=Pseudonocardia sp. TRM90224 TaxID=2812678 RepID=UPI001E28FDA4|nr:ComF family protein [Pseudonocardia sp. TRM90224]
MWDVDNLAHPAASIEKLADHGRMPRRGPTLSEYVLALLDLLLPIECAGCDEPGIDWCARCVLQVRSPVWPVAPRDLSVRAVGHYSGPLRLALLRFKERGRRDIVRPLAALMAEQLDAATDGVAEQGIWLVPAPSRRSAARKRGGDHMLRLCRRMAAEHRGVMVADMLRLGRGVRDSVGLDAAERAANLEGRIVVRAGKRPPEGAEIVLVDDVVTTGATLRACRAALETVGIGVQRALVLCDATQGKDDHEASVESYRSSSDIGMSFSASTQVGVSGLKGLLSIRDAGYGARHPQRPI